MALADTLYKAMEEAKELSISNRRLYEETVALRSSLEELRRNMRKRTQQHRDAEEKYDNLLQQKTALNAAKFKLEQELGKVTVELDEIKGNYDNTLSDGDAIRLIAFHSKRAADLSAKLAADGTSYIKVAVCGVCKDQSALPEFVFDECGHGFCQKCVEELHTSGKICPLCNTEGVVYLARNVYTVDTIV